MKKFIAFLLGSVLLVSLFSISAGAALPPVVFGDLNHDYKADILDVTLIQRGLAGAIDFGYEAQLRADFDRDGAATVFDATWIQRQDANITIPESFGGEGSADIHVTSFYADYDSGKAMVGVPVTFTARANCGEEGCTYEFYIDGEKVQDRSEKNTFTYTFTQSGDYDVAVTAYNPYGFRVFSHYRDHAFVLGDYGDPYRYSDYHVTEDQPTGELSLAGAHWIDLMFAWEPTLEVNVIGGTAPYSYSYTISEPDVGGYFTETYYESFGWKLLYKDNIPYLYRDFSGENTVTIDLGMFAPRSSHEIIVQVKDADGCTIQTIPLEFNDEILVG